MHLDFKGEQGRLKTMSRSTFAIAKVNPVDGRVGIFSWDHCGRRSRGAAEREARCARLFLSLTSSPIFVRRSSVAQPHEY